MPLLPGPIARLQFGGRLFGTEEWSCSIMFAGNVVDVHPPTQPNLAEAALRTWIEGEPGKFQNAAFLDFIKFNEVNKADGKYTNADGSNTHLVSPGIATAQGRLALPAQCTMAVTWETDIVRGRGARGRIFPPNNPNTGVNSEVGADGRVSTVIAAAIAEGAKTLLDELNVDLGNWTAVVWSQIAQEARVIERASVGRVVDTQRRRRSSLAEERQVSADLA